MIERLDAEGLLPAITFIFSRAGCDAAVQQCLAAGLRLTTPEESVEIARIVAERTAGLADADLAVLGYADWLTGLRRGIAAHHAGLLPTFKEVVEELFAAGLIRAVFATETLALGINMPARTVVIEKLDKWNGEHHADLTAGEYTQLTGRAGRRGIDVEGHAVVLWQPNVDPLAVAGLAGTRTYPLTSSFRPTYNMAVNLVGQVGRVRAARLLESSFAQFQADRGVVGLARQAARLREQIAGLAVTCELGDIESYDEIRRELGEIERDESRQRSAVRQAEAIASVEKLRPGDIIEVPGGRQAGVAVVLQPGGGGSGDGRPLPLVLTANRQVKRCRWPISRCRSARSSGSGSRRRSARGRPRHAVTSSRRCGTGSPGGNCRVARSPVARSPVARSPVAGGPPGGRGGGARRRERRSTRCAGGCGGIRVTAARTCSCICATWPGGRAWRGRLRRSSSACRAGRTCSPARSAGCARCWRSSATSPATRSPRTAAGSPPCTPSLTCWPPSACAAARGQAWRRPTWRRARRR